MPGGDMVERTDPTDHEAEIFSRTIGSYLEKARTQSRAWARVIELTATRLGGRCPERLAIVHVDALQAAQDLVDQLRRVVPCPPEIPLWSLGAGLSVHAGAGLVGVAMVAAQ